MGTQRSRPQIKEQENSPGKELNEMKASNLTDAEFVVMVIINTKKLSKNKTA